MHSVEIRCYRAGNYTVRRRVHALFSPEVLRAGAMKGISDVSGVVVSCFTLSRLANFTDVSVRKSVIRSTRCSKQFFSQCHWLRNM